MYIIFEGNNNTGKSTQLKRVTVKLREEFKQIDPTVQINTFHEGDTCKNKTYASIVEEILDYARDRMTTQHLIQDTTSKHITISDRSYYSSLVYQGGGDKEMTEYIRMVNRYVMEPDMIFLFHHGDYLGDCGVQDLYCEVLPMATGHSFVIEEDTFFDDVDVTTGHIVESILDVWRVLYG